MNTEMQLLSRKQVLLIRQAQAQDRKVVVFMCKNKNYVITSSTNFKLLKKLRKVLDEKSK